MTIRLALLFLLFPVWAHAQPVLVADINRGGSGEVSSLTVRDDQLYFSAQTPARQHALWSYDADGDGLVLVAQPPTGARADEPLAEIVTHQGATYFMADWNGSRLWEVPPGAETARSVTPDTLIVERLPYVGEPQIIPLGNRVFFAARRSGQQRGELWSYDPATTATTRAAGLPPVPGVYYPVALGGRLYVVAHDTEQNSASGRRLWAYDPASDTAGYAVIDGGPYDPSLLTPCGGQLFFSAPLIDQPFGSNLAWVYDPADQSARVLDADVLDPSLFICHQGTLSFTGIVTGDEVLARYDTGAESLVVAPISTSLRFRPERYAGRLWSMGSDADGYGLWSYDLSTGEHGVVADVSVAEGMGSVAGPRGLAVHDGRLFFDAEGWTGRELWAYDPGRDTLELAVDVRTDESSNPRGLVSGVGRLYFGATDGSSPFAAAPFGGVELWAYDPASGEASLAADVRPGPGRSLPRDMTRVGDALYFSADGDDAGREVWRYDWTTGRATRITDFQDDPQRNGPLALVALGGRLYFTADDGASGRELWVYDPASDQVALAADLAPGPDGSFPRRPFAHAGRLFFQTYTPGTGSRFRSYDPASGEATIVDALSAVEVGWLAEYGGRLLFPAYSGGGTHALWSYDVATGAAGPLGIVDGAGDPIDVLWDPSNPERWAGVEHDGRLYFLGGDDRAPDVWAYDGAAVERIPAPFVSQLTSYGAALYGPGARPETGRGLWRYDPDTREATLVSDLGIGEELFVHDGSLYFAATDGVHGLELYRYDGERVTATRDEPEASLALSAPVPNPTRGDVRLVLQTGGGGPVRATVLDMLGREVLVLYEGEGREVALEVPGGRLAPGVYVVRVAGPDGVAARRFTVAR